MAMAAELTLKPLQRRCSHRICRWLGIVPVTLITLAILTLPTVLPHMTLEMGQHQQAVKWYFQSGWLWKEDTAELSRRGCKILNFKDSRCSCADDILANIMAGKQEAIYADSDWTLIKDPKMQSEGIQGMHYTAWSTHRELRTAGDLRQRHLPLLTKLLLEGTKAVVGVHPDLRDDVAIFLHFPPNIFRLHVHFVASNRTLWAPAEEVFSVQKIVESLQLTKANPIHSSLKFIGPHWLKCHSWVI